MTVSANTLELLSLAEEQSPRRVPMGPGVVVGLQGNSVTCLPLQRLGVRARITSAVAAVEVMETFTNSLQEPIEAVFLFPLTTAATVVRFRMQAGARMLEGQIQDKEAAKQAYEKAARAVFLGPLLEKERDNLFSVNIGILKPGEQVNVELAYAEQVAVLGPDFQFRFPLLLTSRLMPGASVEQPPEGPPELAPGLSPSASLTIQVHLETGGLPPQKLACSQPAACQRLPNNDLTVELAKGAELQLRDFVLSYRTVGERGPQTALRHGPKHFLLNIYPPAARPRGGQPRDLIMLLDVSDHTQPARLQCARAIIGKTLESLQQGERFALVGFNHDLTGYKQGIFCPAEEVQEGIQWLSQIRCSGRADLTVLLERVLTIQPEPGRALSVILFTAGHVGNEPVLYQMLVNHPTAIRFFSVGVDIGVNDAFLRRVAGSTRGTCFVMCPDDNPEPVSQRLIEETRQPLISELALGDQGLGFLPEQVAPTILPGLSGMRPAVVMGAKNGNGALEVRGKVFTGQPWNEALQPVPVNNPYLGVVWAQQRVLELQDELRLITGPRASRMRQTVVELSQEFRLWTDSTAFVLLDTQPTGQSRGTIQPTIFASDWRDESQLDTPAAVATERPRLSNRMSMITPTAGGPTQEPTAEAKAETSEEPPRIRAGLVRTGFGGKESKVSLKESATGKEAGALRPKGKLLSVKGAVKEGAKGGGKPQLGGKPTLGGGKPLLRPREEKGKSGEGAVATMEAPAAPAVESIPEPPPFPHNGPGEAAAPPAPAEPAAPAPPAAAPAPPPPPPPAAAPPPPGPAATGASSGEVDHDKIARDLLKSNEQYRALMMDEVRKLYGVLAQSAAGTPNPNLPAMFIHVVNRIAPAVSRSTVLKDVFDLGSETHQALLAADPQGVQKAQQWVQKFAALF